MQVDGNHLCGLGHPTQTVWFYRDLAETAQPKQSFDIRYLTDRVNAYCQAVSHTLAIDSMALIGFLSHPTLFVREPRGPFRTADCRAPEGNDPLPLDTFTEDQLCYLAFEQPEPSITVDML
jgi:hypothetical protein